MRTQTRLKRLEKFLAGGSLNISLLSKLIILGISNAMALWALTVLLAEGHHLIFTILVIGVLLIDYIFLSERAYPLRFIFPGLFFLLLMVVFPIGFTIYVSFTNYGTGHILPKEMVIKQYTDRLMLDEDFPTYKAQIFKNPAGEFAFLLTAPTGEQLVAVDQTATPLAEAGIKPEDSDGDGKVDRLGDYKQESILNIFSFLAQLENLTFTYADRMLKLRTPETFGCYIPRYQYDPSQDALIDLQTHTTYFAKDGNFTSATGESLDIGYQTIVGWRNFQKLFTDKRYSAPFIQVFVWTFAFAFLSVLETLGLGLFLAVLLNDPKLKLRRLYRVLMVIPYAIPAFITCLVWRGLFNTEVGIINNSIFLPLFGKALPWLQDPFWAKVAILIVNLWLGFPYMMLICSGALQSIPGELYEAAMVDGANGWYRFRRITLPLLLSQLMPLLISSFAFNFNNFNVIYLVTRGRPAIPGSITPTGATDILISYTYRMAFEGGSGGDYGLASAVSLIIFMIISIITWINFKSTRALEEVPQYE
ncbi:MAG TPA: maltose ABC transporter permease MalF [Bacillota bacterium]